MLLHPLATAAKVHKHLAHVKDRLAGRDYLMGSQFTIAACYLFAVATWGEWMRLDMTPHTHLNAYPKRVAASPAVHKVLEIEGLLD